MKLPLYLPTSFLRADEKEREKVCNGYGSKDGLKMPDTMWFLNIKFACQVHDWMFHKGTTMGDFYFSNVMFFWNLTAIIYNGSNFFTVLPRMSRAMKYFMGVMSDCGRDAYWVDKPKNVSQSITIKGSFL